MSAQVNQPVAPETVCRAGWARNLHGVSAFHAPGTDPHDPSASSSASARRPLVIAHRGSSAAFAENTRAAFLHALAEGADGVEVDVHLTRDRQVVCLHDRTLERTSDGSGPVADHTLSQLRRLDFHSWKGAQIPGHYGSASTQLLTLPDLVGLLAEAGRPVKLALEFKHPSPFGHELEERALTWLLGAGWDPETSRIGAVEVSFMSFSAGSLQYLAPTVGAEHLCQLLTVAPAAPVHGRFTAGPLSRAAVRAALRQAAADAERLIWEGRAGIAGPGVEYVREHLPDVKAWLASGRTLRVWTADRDEDVDLLAGAGVQQITTNLPARVLERVHRRERVLVTAGS